MDTLFLNRVRQGLLRKRDSLAEWFGATPPAKKELFLGPSEERSVRMRLGVIEDTIAKVDSKTLGRCEVCHGEVENELLEVDYTACVCIDHLSWEERRQLESELELAQSVQKMLLPQEIPNIPGLQIAAFSRPAQIVGGDYFDFIEFSNGLHGIAIADVAGHGVSASLHMAGIQALLRALVPQNVSPAEVMRQLHKLFIHNIRFETFVTFFLAAFDPATRTLTYCNAGHLPPLALLKTNGEKNPFEMLLPTAAAIGLVEEAEFDEKTIELQTDDLLVLYTDGVTETENLQNQQFGRDRLLKMSRQADHVSVRDVVQRIKLGLEEFSAGKPPADDITIVICKIG